MAKITKNTVSISKGNSKMGAVPSVSLPPIITCRDAAGNVPPCAEKCYAAKLCRLRPSVRQAYERNLRILRESPESYWVQVREAAAMTRFFRFHVSGDIQSADYLEHMVQLAEELPGTQFLAFTKQYALINDFLGAGGVLPENLHIIFSEWGDGWAVPNPHNLPTAAVVFRGQEPHPNWKVCGGNCADCACRGVGCWELRRGETIAFNEH